VGYLHILRAGLLADSKKGGGGLKCRGGVHFGHEGVGICLTRGSIETRGGEQINRLIDKGLRRFQGVLGNVSLLLRRPHALRLTREIADALSLRAQPAHVAQVVAKALAKDPG
jgi:hypothetical protein